MGIQFARDCFKDKKTMRIPQRTDWRIIIDKMKELLTNDLFHRWHVPGQIFTKEKKSIMSNYFHTRLKYTGYIPSEKSGHVKIKLQIHAK